MDVVAILPLDEGPCFTFRFPEARIVPRFHLEGVQAGQRVSVFQIDPDTSERPGLLSTATVGEGGWVDLEETIRGKKSALPSSRSRITPAWTRTRWRTCCAWPIFPMLLQEPEQRGVSREPARAPLQGEVDGVPRLPVEPIRVVVLRVGHSPNSVWCASAQPRICPTVRGGGLLACRRPRRRASRSARLVPPRSPRVPRDSASLMPVQVAPGASATGPEHWLGHSPVRRRCASAQARMSLTRSRGR